MTEKHLASSTEDDTAHRSLQLECAKRFADKIDQERQSSCVVPGGAEGYAARQREPAAASGADGELREGVAGADSGGLGNDHARSSQPTERSEKARPDEPAGFSVDRSANSAAAILNNGLAIIGSAVQSVEDMASDTYSAVSTKAHNVLDIAKTLAVGTGEAASETAHGVAQAVTAGAQWIKEHPNEAIALTAGAAAVIVVEIGTGGLATPVIAAGLNAVGGLSLAATAAGVTIVVYQTTTAADNVFKHGDVGTLFNQETHTLEETTEARERLKKDTGGALFTDVAIVGGLFLSYAGKASPAMSSSLGLVDEAATAGAGAGEAVPPLAEATTAESGVAGAVLPASSEVAGSLVPNGMNDVSTNLAKSVAAGRQPPTVIEKASRAKAKDARATAGGEGRAMSDAAASSVVMKPEEIQALVATRAQENGVWNLVKSGDVEYAVEHINPATEPFGRVFSSTENPMTLQNDVAVLTDEGATLLQAGTRLPNGVQFSPAGQVTVAENGTITFSGGRVITPDEGAILPGGSVLKSGEIVRRSNAGLPVVMLDDGAIAASGKNILQRRSIDLETGSPRIDIYTKNDKNLARDLDRKPGADNIYTPRVDPEKPFISQAVPLNRSDRVSFMASYGEVVSNSAPTHVVVTFDEGGTVIPQKLLSQQDAWETYRGADPRTQAFLNAQREAIMAKFGSKVAFLNKLQGH
jgi:hypothetical protein